MKKYFQIYKATLLDSIQYISNILSGFVSLAVVIFVFICLWRYMYSDSSNLISGYTYSQMLWYVLVTECMWYGTKSRTITKGISEDIKSGTIAYNLNKPYSYVGYIITKYFGEITIRFIISLLVCSIFGLIFIGNIEGFNFINIPMLAVIFIFAILINALIKIAIGLLSFFVEDSTPFYWIYDKIILVLGTMFPIELFPKLLRKFIIYSPIFVVNYGPAKLVVNFSFDLFKNVLLFQVVYIVIVSIIITLIYKRGGKKLSVNGG